MMLFYELYCRAPQNVVVQIRTTCFGLPLLLYAVLQCLSSTQCHIVLRASAEVRL